VYCTGYGAVCGCTGKVCVDVGLSYSGVEECWL
jgi:hypothetical protein